MKSVIYVRTSVDDVGNPRLSTKTQEDVCRDKAGENGDIIVGVYKDVNKSGGKIEIRKDFQKMIKDALNKEFSRIYILTLSRFARDVADQETEIKRIQKIGISVWCVEDGLLEDKNKFMRQVKGAYNEEMLRLMKQQTEVEHSARLKRFIPVSKAPLGYKINKKTKKWEVNKKEAERVRKIFEMKARGVDIKEISKETGMLINTLKYLLKNKSYLGLYKYRDQFYKFHEPIINEGVFNKCQT